MVTNKKTKLRIYNRKHNSKVDLLIYDGIEIKPEQIEVISEYLCGVPRCECKEKNILCINGVQSWQNKWQLETCENIAIFYKLP